jgi:hypothetical protein
MSENSALGWIAAALVVFGIIGLLAWARNDAGIDDRDPDPPSSVLIIVPAPPATTVVEETVPPTTT